MTAWQAASGRVGAVDAVLQALPAHVLMKEMIADGAIGEVHGFRVAIDLPLFTEARTNVPGYVWFGDPANGASALRNNGSHMLHLLVWLFGEVEAVVADQSLRLGSWPTEGGDPIEPRTPDTAFALLRFASGLAGQLGSVWSMVDGEGYRLEIWGARGRLVATAPLFPQAFDTKLFFSGIGGLGQRTQAPMGIPERLKVTPGGTIHADEKSAGRFPRRRSSARSATRSPEPARRRQTSARRCTSSRCWRRPRSPGGRDAGSGWATSRVPRTSRR
jgi:predicted dehydrogenase